MAPWFGGSGDLNELVSQIVGHILKTQIGGGNSPEPLLLCQNCGAQAPRECAECPQCGARFGNLIYCPRCHYEAVQTEFDHGCPKCGYGGGAEKRQRGRPLRGKRSKRKFKSGVRDLSPLTFALTVAFCLLLMLALLWFTDRLLFTF